MKFTTVIATKGIDLNGERFDNLEQLAETAIGKPIHGTFGGVQVGTAEQATIDGDNVVISGRFEELTGEILFKLGLMYIVPGGIMHGSHHEGNVRVFDDFEIREFSLTSTPADPHLKPIEFVDSND